MRDGEAFVPLATGLAGLPFVPRRQPLHFEFLPRIQTHDIPVEQHDVVKWQLREQLAQSISARLTEH
jgi:hypothetical protein